MEKLIRPYGTWPSPISATAMAASLRLNDVQWDTDSDTLVWLEGRGDRGVLVMQTGSTAPRDLTDTLSVRARVGYGGGDFTVAGGAVYFAGPEGRLYRQALAGGVARAITPAFGQAAAPRVSPDGQWVAFVHTYERTDGLALVDSAGARWPRKLAFGADFVMQPVWHPAGDRIAYIAWDHPQMPWDGTELRLLTLAYDAEGVPHAAGQETIAGSAEISIFQPEFSPDGRYLAYISDESGWWQVYVYDLEQRTHTRITHIEAEHGSPAWGQGMRTFAWANDSQSLLYIRNQAAQNSLWRGALDGTETPITALDDYTGLTQIAISPQTGAIALLATASAIPPRVISLTDTTIQIHRRSATESYTADDLSTAQAVSWTGHDGEAAHGLYYPPASARYTGSGQPPLVINIHGGPTSQQGAGYNGRAQFFTSRGYAYLEVNYRGSTGYGRAYRDKLRASWGIYDVEDAATGATYLVEQGLADAGKLVIMGGSAGGFTVLQSLVEKPGFYKAGLCLYGVANQFLLALDTHKFEERYLDSILGPLPEAAELYRARSPYFHADKIKDPIAIFQGEIDQVVPRNQSDDIVKTLRARGVPHEYHVYEGEGHGWRKPETIESFYNSVEKFLIQYVLFG